MESRRVEVKRSGRVALCREHLADSTGPAGASSTRSRLGTCSFTRETMRLTVPLLVAAIKPSSRISIFSLLHVFIRELRTRISCARCDSPPTNLTGWTLSLSKSRGRGVKAEVTSGFVSTFRQAQGTAGLTNLGTRRLFELAVHRAWSLRVWRGDIEKSKDFQPGDARHESGKVLRSSCMEFPFIMYDRPEMRSTQALLVRLRAACPTGKQHSRGHSGRRRPCSQFSLR